MICKHIKIEEDLLKNISLAYINLSYKEPSLKANTKKVVENMVDKKIYIYNTHQEEKYSYNKVNPYNIDNTVLFASYILSSFIGDIALVEDNKIRDILTMNNFTYADSYRASRILMEEKKSEYDSLEYFIDLHRDSSIYDATTCDIEGKKYAKIMFVVGLENNNYEPNLDLANQINNKLKEYNECLSRGIMKKEGEGVNGVYNQDFSQNAILIEVGGQYNTIEEVSNTLEIFAPIYLEVIGLKYE